jgi:hypothetical protein
MSIPKQQKTEFRGRKIWSSEPSLSDGDILITIYHNIY